MASENQNFNALDLPTALLTNLETLGFTRMTPIQAHCLPMILNGRDVIAQAKTGSGKTAAFGLGLLAHVDTASLAVQALILCPTRELADQVGKELRRLARAIPNIKLVSLVGGKPFGPQKGSLQHGAQIVVGTPGRIRDHLSRNTLRLGAVRTLVLDEADRMLDMGFADVVQEIIERTPAKRQTLLFSATYPESVSQMSRRIQKDPVNVTVEEQHEPGAIEQLFYEVQAHERNSTLLALFEHYQPASALVFCHTKKQCDQVAGWLVDHQIEALSIHGDLDQRERDRVLVRFANHSTPVLVATDVAARGLDIKSLEAVINYELPRDPEIYVHRIGRTGRAGEKGLALSIFTEAERARVTAIESFTGENAICDVPESLDRRPGTKIYGPMTTLEISAGRKQKIRPGDLLGALTGDAGLPASAVGKIDIFDMQSFVAIETSAATRALDYLHNGKVKGRKVLARRLT